MSGNAIAFALEQNQLPPVEQLCLIVLADCCGEKFKLEEAVKIVCKHTSLKPAEVRTAIWHLYEAELVQSTEQYSGIYFVAVFS